MSNTIKLTETECAVLFMEDMLTEKNLELGEQLSCEDQGKYSSIEHLVHNPDTNKYYLFDIARWGSYHTDYDFTYETTLHEVRKEEVVVTKWIKV